MAYPDDGDDRLRDLHSQGISANAIAKQLGCSVSTVSRHAKDLGLSFVRTGTAAAVEAHRIDAAVRRQALILRGYARAEKIYDRLEAPAYKYRVVYKDDTELVTDENPPAADERALQAAIAGHMVMVTRLEQIDASSATGRSDALVDALVIGFAAAAENYTPPPV